MTRIIVSTTFVALIIASFTISSCTEEVVAPPPIVIPGDGEEIVYSTHVEPIFYNHCAGAECHVNGDNEAGLSLDEWNDLKKGSEYGSVVVPFSPLRSHMFQHINTDSTLGPTATPTMPLSRDPLSNELVKTIKRWIAEGAQNDDGEILFEGPERPRVFVTCQREDVFSVIDIETEFVARYIEAGSRPNETTPPESPHNIALSPDGDYIYINLIGSGFVEKFDAQTFEKLGDVRANNSPSQIRVTDDGETLYVANFDQTLQQEFVTEIDASSMQVLREIETDGKAPHGVTLGLDEQFLYTMNAESDDISKIDLASGDVVARIPIVPGSPPAPAGGAMHEPYQSEISDDNLLFVTCRKSGEVRVVDLATDKIIDSISVGSRPLIPAFNGDKTELWIPNQGSNSVSIIDVASRTVVATIDGFNAQPHGIVFAKNGTRAFVSCENQKGGENLHHPLEGTEVIPGIVYSVEVASRSILRPIEVAGFAAGIVARE